MRVLSLVAALASLTLVDAGQAQRFDVVSTLGPAVEQQAHEAAVQARDAYAALGLRLRKPHLPVRIILLPTVLELAPAIGPSGGRSRAFSLAGHDRNYIVVAWAAPGDALRAAAHEYAHLVDPLDDAPAWFREGFAEYLSYLERDQDEVWRAAPPARHIVRLQGSPWLDFDELWRTVRTSEGFSSPTFYAQSWLAVHWLASRGIEPRELRPESLDAARRELGREGLANALRAHFESLVHEELERSAAVRQAAPTPTPERAWEVETALAEVDIELGRYGRARATLERLLSERPTEPAVAAALGALAMDRGEYGEAERFLERAARSTEAAARTRYRLALMLLRPSNEPPRDRAQRAAEQVRRALEQYPASPDYRFALAQALMVDEQWNPSARELARLAAFPAWRERADEEMGELLRRRQQALLAVSKPATATAPAGATVSNPPLEVPLVPRPPKPPPPPPMRWPPPGATILAGRVSYVDCSGPDKIISMRHPLLKLRIRERHGKPAKLFHPPIKSWTEIPCGSKGWTVNIAYYPRPRESDILGDAAAILF